MLDLKNSIRIRVLTTLAALSTPLIVSAQPTSFRNLVEDILLPLLQLMVSFIMGITILIIIWNGAQMIIHADNAQKKADSKAMLLWSVVILFIMISIWGIVAIIRTTLGV